MAVDGAGEPDLTNLSWFLSHLEPRDRDAAATTRRLLAAGWRARSFCGPVQMDVWELVLERGDWMVRFGIERGYSDGVLAKGPDEEWRPLRSLPAEVMRSVTGDARSE